MNKNKIKIKSQSGMTAILTIIIIGSVSLIMAKNASMLGINGVDMSYTFIRGQEALTIAESCAEETIHRFQLDENYNANNFLLTIGDGSCIINTITNKNQHIINIQGNINNYYKKIKVEITMNQGQIIIDNWEEI